MVSSFPNEVGKFTWGQMFGYGQGIVYTAHVRISPKKR